MQLGANGRELREFVVVVELVALRSERSMTVAPSLASSSTSGLSPTRVTPLAMVLDRNKARSSVERMM